MTFSRQGRNVASFLVDDDDLTQPESTTQYDREAVIGTAVREFADA